ncbi:hypothetical protein TUM12370_25290 [Salmonella enterica subsp. enterica serovar Choleraesuis]|nr:hypothetical protein TUM12370_25290 [Salmonella enterica subsp. enterica serovar Choleraesuis]
MLVCHYWCVTPDVAAIVTVNFNGATIYADRMCVISNEVYPVAWANDFMWMLGTAGGASGGSTSGIYGSRGAAVRGYFNQPG